MQRLRFDGTVLDKASWERNFLSAVQTVDLTGFDIDKADARGCEQKLFIFQVNKHRVQPS